MKPDYEELYHRIEDQHWWHVSRRHIVRDLVRQVNADHCCDVLEIGCSGGILLRQLHNDGYTRVTGIDISADAIARCAYNGLTNVYEMDARQPHFAAESFDVIIASDVLEHIADTAESLRAWHRLLRPFGVLIVFVPAFQFLWSIHDIVNNHEKRYTLRELTSLLIDAGFHVERRGYWNFAAFLPVLAVRLALKLLRVSRDSAAHDGMAIPPKFLNILLAGLMRFENRLICAGVRWPWGVSAMAIGRKAF
jgi:SAM-dependent methyltransferase